MHKSATPTRIALVDDDSSVRRAITRLLHSCDYECLAYESAESALADPEFFGVNCLVLDLELPGMNGFELRDRLTDLGSKIPCLFVTAHEMSDFLDWAVHFRDGLHLKKPVEQQQLLSLIERLTSENP
jgi:FixJ family two-component response regulator